MSLVTSNDADSVLK